MDTVIKIKEEFPHSDKVASQHEGQLDAVNGTVLHHVAIKTEIKSETTSPDFGFEIERKYLPGAPKMEVTEYNSNNEAILGVDDELCWRETGSSSASVEIKDADFTSGELPRPCTEEGSDDSSSKSPRPSAGEPQYSRISNDVATETNSDVETVDSEQFGNDSDSCMQQMKRKKIHKCKVCEKRFTLKASLKRHSLIHTDKQPHKCEICDKRFSRLSYLKCHTLSHQGIRPYKCEICGKGFTRSSHLKYHYLMHEGKKPHKCKTCDKSFSRLSHLKYHNLLHEGKKDYQCEICEKRFTGLSDLKKHNLFHEAKLTHKCRFCEKGFNRMSDLKKHILVHTGEKPHECEICEKRFTQLGNFKRHYLIHQRKNEITV